jgi:threonine synthase
MRGTSSASGEGHTPLLDYLRSSAARPAGSTLQLKEEGKRMPGFGANPTQSFKDRGMAMVVAQARRSA